MKPQLICLLCVLIAAVFILPVRAAFMVETHSSGRGYTNFVGTGPSYTTTQSTAPGLDATHSAFGGTAVAPQMDTYTFSYTPGVDADNWDVPQYKYFGNGLYTTNLPGGQTGYYNVYITWPASTNVSALCDIIITSAGGPITLLNINMNTGGTSALAESLVPDPLPGTVFLGGNNAWLKIASDVLLTAGTTYTVTQITHENTYVSMRSSAVMWEFSAIPEPATIMLLGWGMMALRRRFGN